MLSKMRRKVETLVHGITPSIISSEAGFSEQNNIAGEVLRLELSLNRRIEVCDFCFGWLGLGITSLHLLLIEGAVIARYRRVASQIGEESILGSWNYDSGFAMATIKRKECAGQVGCHL